MGLKSRHLTLAVAAVNVYYCGSSKKKTRAATTIQGCISQKYR